MNIYAQNGFKVVFKNPDSGYVPDQENAAEHLEVESEYTVDHTVVEKYSTKVYLEEVPDVAFNSVMFDDAPGASQSAEDDQKHPHYNKPF